jgi:hypothetical protein
MGSRESAALNFGMAELMQTIGKADLVKDFQNRRMKSVATELAVEIGVCLEQCNRDALACQEQRKDHPARPASDHAAGGFMHIADIVNGGLAGSRLDTGWHKMDLLWLG